jgi:hypothetical protein
MKTKVHEKQIAVELRKKGYSYNDILKEVHVAKSSLSLWLKDLPLTESEKEYLHSRKDINISRGRIKVAAILRDRRLKREDIVCKEAVEEYERYKKDELFKIGVALYWAEGAKRNSYFAFSNSDYKMMRVMVCWIEKILDVKRNNLHVYLYIHKPYAHENCEGFWSEKLTIPLTCFRKTTYKPTNKQVKKRPQYKGCLRIVVPKSSVLLKKMKVWQNMLAKEHMRPW